MSNFEIESEAKKLKIKNFRGVFMRDELKNIKPKNKECGIFNLNTSKEPGSHWVCWYKNGTNRLYFDSFGVIPPQELIDYLGTPILRNTTQLQAYNQSNCGEFCLYVLNRLSDGDSFQNIEAKLSSLNNVRRDG